MKTFLLSLVIGVFAGMAVAAEPNQVLTTTDSAKATDAKLLLGGELRPSRLQTRVSDQNVYSTEDNVFAGYQFSKDSYLFYRQDFSTNVYHTQQTKDREGMDLRALDGSFRGGINNFWKEGNLSLSYEGRAFVPTSTASSRNGMISVVRSYGHLRYDINDSLAIVLSEAPTFHAYAHAAYTGADGKSVATPWYENRTYLMAKWFISKKMRLDFPIKMTNLRYRNPGAAKNADSWAHVVYLNPELFYNVTPNFYVGLGFYSASMVQSDFGGFSLGDALKYGQTQVIVGAKL